MAIPQLGCRKEAERPPRAFFFTSTSQSAPVMSVQTRQTTAGRRVSFSGRTAARTLTSVDDAAYASPPSAVQECRGIAASAAPCAATDSPQKRTPFSARPEEENPRRPRGGRPPPRMGLTSAFCSIWTTSSSVRRRSSVRSTRT